ncbi:MAG: hypothetical protein JJD98_10390 [Polaromonas sp.]|nr:hypothetical protein [Polaromonas sp.]
MPTLQVHFPDLNDENHRPTSPVTSDYNCIAWAAEEDDCWWWPLPVGAGYWPPGVVRAETVDAFVSAFATIGFLPCETSAREANVQKVAIYTVNNVPTHMARQLSNSTWTSKLEPNIDINHFTLEALHGPAYGEATHFLSRHIADEAFN